MKRVCVLHDSSRRAAGPDTSHEALTKNSFIFTTLQHRRSAGNVLGSFTTTLQLVTLELTEVTRPLTCEDRNVFLHTWKPCSVVGSCYDAVSEIEVSSPVVSGRRYVLIAA